MRSALEARSAGHRRWVSAAVALVGFAARAEAPADRVGLSVVLAGDERPLEEVRDALGRPGSLPVEVRFALLPNLPPLDPGTGETEARLAAARKEYVDANFRKCLERVPRGKLVTDLLGADRPAGAARVLFWRVACQVGEGVLEEARIDARAFAALELEIPPDVEKAAPEVEAVLATAMREAAAAPRVPLKITANVGRAVVSIDGRPGLCVTPCEVQRRPGDHVLRLEADGAAPDVQVVRAASPGASVAAVLATASPELAARQWTARYAGNTAAIDSSASARLLAQSLRDRRVALLVADSGSTATRLRGVLVIDGEVAARAERTAGKSPDLARLTPELVRDLLVKGAVVEPAPPLYRQPVFWVVVGAVAVAAAGAVTGTVVALTRPIKTEVKF